MEIYEVPEIYESVVWSDDQNFNQIRVVVNTFYDTEYFHLRKYYLDFDGDWQPTAQGVAMPLDLESTRAMFKTLAEIISLAESREVIEEYFGDIIKEIYK